MTETYPAKLLLFGEYTIIEGSLALAVPHPVFAGTLKYSSENNHSPTIKGSQKSLEKIADYLQNLENSGSIKSAIDIEMFYSDLKKGLWFDSSIPTGYGLGSSGAVCAAIYERYCMQPAPDLIDLRAELSQLEGCFHGKSSGIDPLVSYLRKAVLIKNKSEIEILSNFSPDLRSGQGAIFLIDTKISRETPPLVEYYLKEAQKEHFASTYIAPVSDLVKKSIGCFLSNEYEALLDPVSTISKLQYHYMSHFIPDAFRLAWEAGLRTKKYALKLCGAGGGGFILGFTADWEQSRMALSDYAVSKLYDL